jgi:hypothetical protein
MSKMLKVIFSASVAISVLYAASATTVAAQQILPYPGVPGFDSGPYLPGYGSLPQDGTILAEITQQCGGQPGCIALAWGSVEVDRCRNGIGVPGGCFGPNGEIRKFFDNAVKDVTQGPGPCNFIRNPFGRGC